MNASLCKYSKLIVNDTPYLSADGVLGFDGVPDRLAGDLNLKQVQAKDKLMVKVKKYSNEIGIRLV